MQQSDKESYFGIEEFFVSVTDKKGIIQTGNDVFVRVSGYSRDQLIGSPHNVIRHPDMPKSVFKLLWDTIKQNKNITAYVKNRSVDGAYYWVLATVIPTETQYLSLRLKPTSPILKIVEDLYKVVLREEKTIGMDKGIELILAELKKLGFDSYESFMSHALITELKARDEAMSSAKFKNNSNVLKFLKNDSYAESYDIMNKVCSNSAKDFATAFEKLTQFSNVKKDFSEQTDIILNSCQKLSNLSLNMSVTANKLGKEGASLTMVSTAFQRAAKDIVDRFETFGKKVNEIAQCVFDQRLALAVARKQTEMLSFYTTEILQNVNVKNNSNFEKRNLMFHDSQMLLDLIKKQFFHLQTQQRLILQEMIKFESQSVALRNNVVSLDLIRLGGKLEGSRTNQAEEAFFPYIQQMIRFIDSVDQPIDKISKLTKNLITVFSDLSLQLETISSQLVFIEMVKYRIKNLKEEQNNQSPSEAAV